MKRCISFIPFIIGLTSCASHLSLEQCQTMNWSNVGYQDAIIGKMPRDLSGAIKDCQKFNLTVNTELYAKGWQNGAKQYCTPARTTGILDGEAGSPANKINERMPLCDRANIHLNLKNYRPGYHEGLRRYCTYENGENIARQGLALPDVCTPELKNKFTQGWSSGAREYCNQIANAFALGKAGQGYPGACPEGLYVGFKSEYDRGMLIHNRINSVQSRINKINDRINEKKHSHSIHQNSDGFYSTTHQSKAAVDTVNELNNLVRERQHLEREVFNLQAQR